MVENNYGCDMKIIYQYLYTWCINSLRLRDTMWHHWSSLVQVITRCLMAPSHNLNQCRLVNLTMQKKLYRNFNQMTLFFTQENAFENVISNKATINHLIKLTGLWEKLPWWQEHHSWKWIFFFMTSIHWTRWYGFVSSGIKPLPNPVLT